MTYGRSIISLLFIVAMLVLVTMPAVGAEVSTPTSQQLAAD